MGAPRQLVAFAFTRQHEQAASPKRPMPEALRRPQLLTMWSGLASIERGENPTPDDWRACSDAVNVLESLRAMGAIEDAQGLLEDAIAALAHAGERHLRGLPIRLDAAGIQAVRAVLEDYAAALEGLPHRLMVKAFRRTDERIAKILRTTPAPGVVERTTIAI